jgi:uncharacterized protein YukE
MTSLSVPPQAVAGLADAVGQARDEALTAARPYLDQLDQTARALHGWRLGQALTDLESSWHDHVARLTGQLGELADGLERVAATYRDCEQGSAGRFRTIR